MLREQIIYLIREIYHEHNSRYVSSLTIEERLKLKGVEANRKEVLEVLDDLRSEGLIRGTDAINGMTITAIDDSIKN